MFGTCHQLFVTIGSLIASLIGLIPDESIGNRADDYAQNSPIWRVSFAVPFFFALLQSFLLFFVYKYESPPFYVDKDDNEKANEALSKIYATEADANDVFGEISVKGGSFSETEAVMQCIIL